MATGQEGHWSGAWPGPGGCAWVGPWFPERPRLLLSFSEHGPSAWPGGVTAEGLERRGDAVADPALGPGG